MDRTERQDNFGRSRGFNNKRYPMEKPVKEGDVIEIDIESVGKNGDGVARRDNFVIFAKGAQKGQKCKVRITQVKRSCAIGEVVEE